MTIEEAVSRVRPLDAAAMRAAEKRFSDIAMPLGGLGLLQDAIIQLAGIQRKPVPIIRPRAAVIFCADNGVVAEGVTQCGQDVTATVTRNMGQGRSTMCMMAKSIDMDVFPVDIGVAEKFSFKGVVDKKIRKGTENIAENAAMTRDEAITAVKTGIELAENCAQQGFRLVCGGEMGIGNTTTTSAVASVLLDIPVEQATGKGAGLTSAGLERKINVIKKAIEVNKPNSKDPLDVLMKLGGYDICAMTGAFLGGGMYKIPIVIDGVIACLSAYIACLINPNTIDYILPSHMGREPVARVLLEKMNLKPVIYGNMALGEGSGAVMLFPLLDMAMALYNNVTFEEIEMKPYERLV